MNQSSEDNGMNSRSPLGQEEMIACVQDAMWEADQDAPEGRVFSSIVDRDDLDVVARSAIKAMQKHVFRAHKIAAEKIYSELARQGGNTMTITDVEADYLAKLLLQASPKGAAAPPND